MGFIRKTWYLAGFADEVAEGQLLARTLLGEPLVFFRMPDGRVAALHDRCPHRFAPLSAGQLCDGGAALQCPYHGLRFNGQGACVHNPRGDGALPASATVRAYPVHERDGLLWWWAGDPETADESLIPDFSDVVDAPPDGTIRGYLPTACDYRLLVNNILDLSHADYMHAGSLGNGSITRVLPEVTDLGPRSLRVRWINNDEAAPPAFDQYLGGVGARADQCTEVTWMAPGVMYLRLNATLHGQPQAEGVEPRTLHIATPATAYTTHYWYWSTRTFAVNPHANAEIRKVIDFAFAEQDKPMLEAQQRRMGTADFWSLSPVLLAGDAASVRVRRKIDALVAAEQVPT